MAVAKENQPADESLTDFNSVISIAEAAIAELTQAEEDTFYALRKRCHAANEKEFAEFSQTYALELENIPYDMLSDIAKDEYELLAQKIQAVITTHEKTLAQLKTAYQTKTRSDFHALLNELNMIAFGALSHKNQAIYQSLKKHLQQEATLKQMVQNYYAEPYFGLKKLSTYNRQLSKLSLRYLSSTSQAIYHDLTQRINSEFKIKTFANHFPTQNLSSNQLVIYRDKLHDIYKSDLSEESKQIYCLLENKISKLIRNESQLRHLHQTFFADAYQVKNALIYREKLKKIHADWLAEESLTLYRQLDHAVLQASLHLDETYLMQLKKACSERTQETLPALKKRLDQIKRDHLSDKGQLIYDDLAATIKNEMTLIPPKITSSHRIILQDLNKAQPNNQVLLNRALNHLRSMYQKGQDTAQKCYINGNLLNKINANALNEDEKATYQKLKALTAEIAHSDQVTPLFDSKQTKAIAERITQSFLKKHTGLRGFFHHGFTKPNAHLSAQLMEAKTFVKEIKAATHVEQVNALVTTYLGIANSLDVLFPRKRVANDLQNALTGIAKNRRII